MFDTPSSTRPLSTAPSSGKGIPLRQALIALPSCPEVSRAVVYRLAAGLVAAAEAGELNSTPSPVDASEWAHRLELPRTRVRRALRFLEQEGARVAEAEQAAAEALGARILTPLDEEYPAPLRTLSLAPPALSVLGTLSPVAAGAGHLSIVGSRAMDGYGREAALLFAREAARAGVCVVSGFARGVDATAHRAALEAGGTTLAVLGSGIGVDYPSGHRTLGREIAARGALISEFRCGERPQTWHFPIRNRLIAVLGDACLVVQASTRSGSLSTAHLALDAGRDVFAVPGRIFDERSLGTNALIRDGAAAALHPRDVLERMGWAPTNSAGSPSPADQRALPTNNRLRRIVESLAVGDPLPFDALAERTGSEVEDLLGALLELELLGWVRRHPGPAFSRAA